MTRPTDPRFSAAPPSSRPGNQPQGIRPDGWRGGRGRSHQCRQRSHHAGGRLERDIVPVAVSRRRADISQCHRTRGAPAQEGHFRARRDDGAPRAHRARQPQGQRDRDARRRACHGRRGTSGRGDGAERPDRRASWPARGPQGSRRYGGHPDDEGVAVLSRQRADRGRADRHAHARGGRADDREDQHAGDRRGLADVQPDLRRDAESLRCRRRPAAEAAAAPPSRWRAAWCRSPMAAIPAGRCAIPRPSATSSGCGPRRGAWRASDPSWSPLSVAGPMARTVADVALFLSVLAGPDDRSPLSLARGRRALPRRARPQLQRRARRLVARPRRHSVRARDSRDHRCASQDVRGSRLQSSKMRSRTSPESIEAFPTLRYVEQSPAVLGDDPAAAGLGQGHDQVRSRAGRTH